MTTFCLLLTCVNLTVPAIAPPQGTVPKIKVVIGGNETVAGTQLLYEIREQVRRSSRFVETTREDPEKRYGLMVVALDTNPGKLPSAFGVAYTELRATCHHLLHLQVLRVGDLKITESARLVVATLDEHIPLAIP